MAENGGNDNNTCVVCFKNVLYYSIGECDHPVCFECSTRMRVLCQQNECPICRQGLLRVVFTESIQTFKELRNKIFSDRLFERQYKIGFCSEEIKNAYEQLLENCCKICEDLPPFRSFGMLNDHMRKVHERFFCELCVKHLKIFTGERKCYTRQELAHHRRKGDLDDTSHRGHPLCEFCEERFMDADELYRHLRKEHLYCHLCDADGKNLYYASHSSLAHHFRSDHYLCEEGDCAGQHLTAVFRSDIDLKAHKATVHGRGMARGAARQARTLELQFNITPHPVVQRMPRERGERGERGDRGERSEGTRAVSPVFTPPAPLVDTCSDAHFPRLSAAQPSQNLMLGPTLKNYKGADGLTRNDRNFPALEGGARGGPAPAPAPAPPPGVRPAPVAAALLRNSKPSVSIQLHSQPTSASNFRLTQTSGSRISIPQKKTTPLSDDDFPSLGIAKDDHPSIGAGTVQPPKVTLINSQEMSALKTKPTSSKPKKPPLSTEAFPALSSSVAPTAPPQWITVSKAKEKVKPVKAEPTPRAKQLNDANAFPTLRANKIKSKPQPASQPPPPPSQSDKNKKEKKKNLKKDNDDWIQVNNIDKLMKDTLSFATSVNNNNQSTEADKKIKTVESVTINSENRNGSDFALASKDYPPLNPKNGPASKKINGPSVRSVDAPPGFKARPACDGMTFTNSSGQTFSAPVHTYIPPPDFEGRNRALVNKFAAALGGADAFENFKVASRAFRDGILNADEFYQHCKTAIGDRLDDVFPELVALLPDIGKQQELAVGVGVASALAVCSACGQLLAPQDAVAHDAAHWPPLAPR